MVFCAMEPPVPPPPLNSSSSHKGGFRLQDQNDDAASIYSVYKQKIDSMFESDSSSKTQSHNAVQARIEKMFSDVTKDDNAASSPPNEIGCHIFSVDYLGSVPLREKVTSLSGLQTPLKELYFSYKKAGRHKRSPTGRLEISSGGLRVQYQGEKGDLEQTNSFPTIAVWSAVKFVLHERQSYAFLPLITDPDNLDKQQLFREFTGAPGVDEGAHSPLFAVVMRKVGAQRQLECHGFVCQTSEDAIVIAATLYKALMAHMKAKERRPRNRNGVTCMSVTSSIYNEAVDAPPAVPVRPPRKKRDKGSVSSGKSQHGDTVETMGTSDTQPLLSDKEAAQKGCRGPKRAAPKAPTPDLDAIVPYVEAAAEEQHKDEEVEVQEIKPQPIMDRFNTYRSTHQKQITAEIKQVMTENANMGLKRAKSVRKRAEDAKGTENTGDILTKVTIPRSGSFLNAGGLTRYKSKVQRSNGQASGGSPLGFSELFNEFRLQEGLHSIDEILGVIIDPEGMSFNDLKPIYKEFLLKLALTLTKDELYQRSKSIMRRHRKKLMKSQSGKKRVPAYAKFKRLKHIFQKLKAARDFHDAAKKAVPESSLSSSTSYDARQFRPKETRNNVHRRLSYKKRNQKCRRDRVSTSEESDFFSLRRKRNATSTQNRNSSSGYVSCSECSYDSDSCTCVSADKCYCSLGDKNHKERGFVFCGCDTDSCTDSNKCYCTAKKKGTIFEQLKERGFIPTSQEMTTPPHHRKLCKKNSNTKSTRSLEYVANPYKERYYEKLGRTDRKRRSRGADNLAVDYELFSIANGKICNITNDITAICGNKKNNHRSSVGSYKYNQNKKIVHSSIPVKACTEALSVKKSAEIAALFADIKLSQTTDIAHLIPRRVDPDVLAEYNGAPRRCSSRLDGFADAKPQLQQQPNNRMVNNSLYTAKNAMYSANNGLYTIQSQSDDSRSSPDRSSRRKEDKASTVLENSLGYLP